MSGEESERMATRDGLAGAGAGAAGAGGQGAEPTGVAVVGCGSIARSHFAGWRRLVEAGRARLGGGLRQRPGARRGGRREYGAAARPTDFEEVVRRPEVQAVDVCLPHHLHLPAILAAARAGKHVLCEKPLVLNLEEAAHGHPRLPGGRA